MDFARLLPRDCMSREVDHRMELVVNCGGSTFFVPIADHESAGSVSNFYKWEQAFCVFSNIYTKFYPDRAPELIQYNQLIHTASLSFTWDNVYRYDKEFRLHMSKYPQRNWGVILQQAWTVYLKDRVNFKQEESYFPKGNTSGNGNRKKEICKRFNKGKCYKGFKCHYDHRCLECGKFGHGAHICRNKRSSDASTSNATENAVQTSGNSK